MEDSKGNIVFASLKNISKSFGKVKALEDASIEIERNKITAIVGDNGSGKSTLIKILSGAIRPDSGSIYIEGKPYRYLIPKLAYQHGIATVYQDLALDNFRDVAGNIFLGREITKFGFILDYKRMYEETETLLKKLNIDIPYLKTPVGFLSGGQRQSVAIGRAIYQGKKLIILDEPTAAMGVKESIATNNLIKSLPNRGFSVLVISHDIYQVFDIADKIYIMEHGEVVDQVMKAQITPQELRERISRGVKKSLRKSESID